MRESNLLSMIGIEAFNVNGCVSYLSDEIISQVSYANPSFDTAYDGTKFAAAIHFPMHKKFLIFSTDFSIITVTFDDALEGKSYRQANVVKLLNYKEIFFDPSLSTDAVIPFAHGDFAYFFTQRQSWRFDVYSTTSVN